MLFNSYIFIFLFLPLTLAGWYSAESPESQGKREIISGGNVPVVYGYFNVYYLAVIVASILGNYFLSCLMRFSKSRRFSRLGLLAGFC